MSQESDGDSATLTALQENVMVAIEQAIDEGVDPVKAARVAHDVAEEARVMYDLSDQVDAISDVTSVFATPDVDGGSEGRDSPGDSNPSDGPQTRHERGSPGIGRGGRVDGENVDDSLE